MGKPSGNPPPQRVCLAPKARIYTSLGQRPRKRVIYHLSAESAGHRGEASSFIREMERAFSPEFIGWHRTWGVAPGWYEARLWRSPYPPRRGSAGVAVCEFGWRLAARSDSGRDACGTELWQADCPHCACIPSAHVAQVSKPAVSPTSKSAGRQPRRARGGFRNPRYSRLGSLRYGMSRN